VTRPIPAFLKPPLRWADRHVSRVPWANLGPLSRYWARTIPPRTPPVLVLSLPRSGSSWVGNTLGAADDALYLREPVTQPFLAGMPAGHPSVFEVDPDAPPEAYRRFAERAFAALPAFPRGIVRSPRQWALGRRRARRLVVKEVNPLALAWLVGAFRPRIIYLVRHPAAVAASFARMGWTGAGLTARFTPRTVAAAGIDPGRFDGSFWAGHGAFQALTLRVARQVLDGYADCRWVRYEDLCTDPEGVFRTLADFAGLAWGPGIERAITAQGEAGRGRTDDPYDTHRDSRAMAEAWRGSVPEAEARAVRDAYLAFDPAFYGPEAW
jgi:hypothetical protein